MNSTSEGILANSRVLKGLFEGQDLVLKSD